MDSPTHKQFMKATYSRYASMEQRFGQLPFSLLQFREFLINILGGQQGMTRCEYCAQPIDIGNLEIDHRLPPSQGGSVGLDNLTAACTGCNQAKGEMSAGAFRSLLMLVSNDEKFFSLGLPRFSETDRTSLLSRLQSQLKLAIREQIRQKAARGAKVRITPHQRSRKAPADNARRSA